MSPGRVVGSEWPVQERVRVCSVLVSYRSHQGSTHSAEIDCKHTQPKPDAPYKLVTCARGFWKFQSA